MTIVVTGATFSPCRKYRYTLWRTWDRDKPSIAWIGLNPSTADETVNDPTVERCQRRSVAMGFGTMYMLNLFAFRATDPREMKLHPEPVGPDNDSAIIETAKKCDIVVACWGTHGEHLDRGDAFLREFVRHKSLHCLGATKAGFPRHPLYVPYSQGLERMWTRRMADEDAEALPFRTRKIV